MFQWIGENAGTIVVSIALIVMVAGIVISLRRDKKQGKSSCGANCGCCPMSGSCHKAAKQGEGTGERVQ